MTTRYIETPFMMVPAEAQRAGLTKAPKSVKGEVEFSRDGDDDVLARRGAGERRNLDAQYELHRERKRKHFEGEATKYRTVYVKEFSPCWGCGDEVRGEDMWVKPWTHTHSIAGGDWTEKGITYICKTCAPSRDALVDVLVKKDDKYRRVEKRSKADLISSEPQTWSGEFEDPDGASICVLVGLISAIPLIVFVILGLCMAN